MIPRDYFYSDRAWPHFATALAYARAWRLARYAGARANGIKPIRFFMREEAMAAIREARIAARLDVKRAA